MQAPQLFNATVRPLRRSEYEEMASLGFFAGERVELIHGIVVRVPPIKPPHADVVDRLNVFFIRVLGDRARVRIQQLILAAGESEPEPDVAVVPLQSYAERHPDRAALVVEVAESSLVYDRETKAPLYAASNVDEYWIVDVAGRAVEVHADPIDGAYTTFRRVAVGETVSPKAFPDVAVAVADLFR